MEHLLDHEGAMERVLSSPELLLMLDYDGTLTPIVDRPEDAHLAGDMRHLLGDLAHIHGVTLAVISGRSLEDITARVGVKDIIYVGNHGMETRGVPPLPVDVIAGKKVIGEVSKELSGPLSDLRGVILEDKGLTLSVHYRLADPETVAELKTRFPGLVAPFGKSLRITHGRKVIEVRPSGFPDKGDIARHLVDLVPSGLPVYIGDDITDEDAFKALWRSRAVTVLVTSKATKSSAKYFLKDPDEVKGFLEILRERRA